MSNLERLPTWVSQFETTQEIKEYENLTNDFNILRIKVESKQEITEEQDKEFLRIIKSAWKRIITEKYNELKSKIERNKNKGQSFSNNLKELEKIRSEGEKDLRVDKYYELYHFNLLDIEKDVDDNLIIIKYQKKQNRNMLIYGFILGVGSSIVAGILLAIFVL